MTRSICFCYSLYSTITLQINLSILSVDQFDFKMQKIRFKNSQQFLKNRSELVIFESDLKTKFYLETGSEFQLM